MKKPKDLKIVDPLMGYQLEAWCCDVGFNLKDGKTKSVDICGSDFIYWNSEQLRCLAKWCESAAKWMDEK